jgi:hypothetical protein
VDALWTTIWVDRGAGPLTGFLATLTFSDILALLEAVVAKRSFASQVVALGRIPQELLLRAGNGGDFRTAVSEAAFAGALRHLEERRRKVLGLLRADGWKWEDV